MTQRKRGLGRGLDALIDMTRPLMGGGSVDVAAGELRNLALDSLQAGRFQPRRDWQPEPLAELADSIRAQGIIQPLVVRAVGEGRYEIIAGERRFRAARLAGLTEVPVLVRDIPDRAALSVALIENIQRQDLNPVEEARALERLIAEFALTHEEAAAAVGRSRAAVTNLLRLLALADPVREALERGELEMGHGRAMLSLAPGDQQKLAERVIEEGLSVRATEALVRDWGQARPAAAPAVRRPDPNVEQLSRDLSERLGAPVRIQHGPRGGKLVIRYGTLDELDGILEHIR